MSGIPNYDAWKLATPPEYERDGAPAAGPPAPSIPGHRHYCHEWDLALIDDSMPEFEACLCYPPEEDVKW